MKMPRRTQAAWRVIEALFVHGPLTFEDGVRVHRLLGRNRNTTRAVYVSAEKQGWIYLSEGRYRLTQSLSVWLEKEEGSRRREDLVMPGPPYRPPFRELAEDKWLPKQGPRGDGVR